MNSMMIEDLITGLSSTTKLGTTPLGLIARYSGACCSTFVGLVGDFQMSPLSQTGTSEPFWNRLTQDH